MFDGQRVDISTIIDDPEFQVGVFDFSTKHMENDPKVLPKWLSVMSHEKNEKYKAFLLIDEDKNIIMNLSSPYDAILLYIFLAPVKDVQTEGPLENLFDFSSRFGVDIARLPITAQFPAFVVDTTREGMLTNYIACGENGIMCQCDDPALMKDYLMCKASALMMGMLERLGTMNSNESIN